MPLSPFSYFLAFFRVKQRLIITKKLLNIWVSRLYTCITESYVCALWDFSSNIENNFQYENKVCNLCNEIGLFFMFVTVHILSSQAKCLKKDILFKS